jgi:hypothetical protein
VKPARWLLCLEEGQRVPIDQLFAQPRTRCRCAIVVTTDHQLLQLSPSGSGLYRIACDAVAWSLSPLEDVDGNITTSVHALLDAARLVSRFYDVYSDMRVLRDLPATTDAFATVRRRGQRVRALAGQLRRRLRLQRSAPLFSHALLDVLLAAYSLTLPLHPWAIYRRVGASALHAAVLTGRSTDALTGDLIERLLAILPQSERWRPLFVSLWRPLEEST